MTDNDIIQEATEAVTKGMPCAFLVPPLLEVVKSQKAEIETKDTEIGILIRKKEALRDEVAEQKAEKERLEYVLMAVMHSVDKWLEGDELKQDEANRACTMREKTLKITEKLHKKIDGLKKANQESWVAIEKKKAEIERLTVQRNTFALGMKVVKSEAYREFADKVKKISKEVTVPYIADTSIQEQKTGMFYYGKEDFDNLLNELTRNLHGKQ